MDAHSGITPVLYHRNIKVFAGIWSNSRLERSNKALRAGPLAPRNSQPRPCSHPSFWFGYIFKSLRWDVAIPKCPAVDCPAIFFSEELFSDKQWQCDMITTKGRPRIVVPFLLFVLLFVWYSLLTVLSYLALLLSLHRSPEKISCVGRKTIQIKSRALKTSPCFTHKSEMKKWQ